MKKFMLLVAVMAAFCGMASAAVAWNNSVDGNTFTLALDADYAARTLNITGIQASVAGTWTLTSLEAGFDTSRKTGIANAGVFYNVGGTASAAPGIAAGTNLVTLTFVADDLTGVSNVDFSFIGAANTYVMDTNTNKEVLSGFSVAVPEPMTMALLGLGGLFIRRRKA